MELEYISEVYINGHKALKEFVKYNLNHIADKPIKLNFSDGIFHFECYARFRNKLSERLNVFLSSGGRKKSDRSTFYHRHSWLKAVKGSGICIEDPMYKLNRNIKNGFYYGTSRDSIITSLTHFINTLIGALSAKNEQLYLIGSSSGGFGALMLSLNFSGCYVIAMNPQILPYVWDKDDTVIFKREIDSSFVDNKSPRNDATRILKNKFNRYFIYFNLSSCRDLAQFNILNKNKKIPTVGVNRLSSNVFVYNFKLDCIHPHDVWLNLTEFLILSHIISQPDISFATNFITALDSLFNTLLSRYKLFYQEKFLDFAVKLMQGIGTDYNLHFKILKQNNEIRILSSSGIATAVIYINDYVCNDIWVYIYAKSKIIR